MNWECWVPEMLWCVDLQLTVQFLGRRKCNSSCCAAISWGSAASVWYSSHLHEISMQNRANTAPLPFSNRDITCLSEAHVPSGRAYCWLLLPKSSMLTPLQCCTRWSHSAQEHGMNTSSLWFTLYLCPGFGWG